MLTIQSVDVRYGHIQALKGISLEVRDGELVALLGANGAGESTTLMCISGIVRPHGGSLTYDDVDLARTSAFDIVGLGIIQCPEGRRIFGGLTVLENLRMGAVRRRDRSEVRRDMERVFSLFPVLGQRRHQSGATLSGGEQQMLAIGRALMASPRLLLLDEPSLGLAPLVVQAIFRVIRELHRQGVTILLVEQNVRQALAVAHVLLHQQDGDPLVVQAIFRVIRELHRQGVTILLVEQNVRQALAVADRGYVLATGRVILEGSGGELRANSEIEQAYLSSAPEAGR